MAIPTKRGFSYPVALQNGGLATAEDDDLIRGEIISVLQTRPFERVMRPEYGTPDYVFDAVGPPAAVPGQVQAALETQISGVGFAVSGEANDSGDYALTVRYFINQIEQPPIQYRLRA